MFCPRVSTISFSASTKHYQDVMMAKLNKQQLALLKEIPADQLMQIICDIAEDNGQAKSFLINKYLLTPEESLKKAEAEYKRVIKTKRFYDYYEAAIFLRGYTGMSYFHLKRRYQRCLKKPRRFAMIYCSHLIKSAKLLIHQMDHGWTIIMVLSKYG